jgi:hypothetical protein
VGRGWWHHRILVIPAIGTDANGNEVRGYWYDYSGGGTFVPTTDGRVYLGMKRDARDILPALRRAPAATNTDRLNELKAMRDRGLITEEEYQAKRHQILDRM